MRLSICLLLFVSFAAKGQVDFDRYTPLRSAGDVPADFSLRTQEKIVADSKMEIPGLSRREQKHFIEQVNYTIDGLLKSGLVTYGDEVSTYLQRIGDRLCENDEELAGKLRFYTLNENEANAFSTNQGMVFVTTGLIAQMTSEAQLAYVLAHEIIHYREKHVLDLYGYITDNRSLSYGEKVRFFSKYSRDNEFEADREGLQLYYDAGYRPEDILVTFDVLIYSYLPFEEVPFDKEYFNTPHMFVPESNFPAKVKAIDVRENYNDRLASHPNIAKRKQSLQQQIDSLANWGTMEEDSLHRFQETRNICRFEYLLNCIYADKGVEALYSIFLLEKSFPGSRFLKHCKSQVWLELMKQKEESDFFNPEVVSIPRPKTRYISMSGEIAALEQFLNGLNSEAKATLGLRVIYDEMLSDTTDALQQKMWDKAIEVAAFNEYFDLEHFSKMTFPEAVAKLEAEKLLQADSLALPGKGWNKYETIRNAKNGLSTSSGIDSTRFYFYGISDLVKDSLFKVRYKTYQQKLEQREEERDDYFALTDAQQQDQEREKYEKELYLGTDTLLMVNPIVTEYKRFEMIDYPKSDKLEQRVVETAINTSSDLGITLKQLDRTEQHSMTTAEYNDLAVLMRSLEKSVTESKPDVFLLDQEILDEIKSRYHTSKVLLLDLGHDYDPGINIGTGILFTVVFPVGLVYFPAAILSGHETVLDVYIFDLSQGKLVAERNYFSNDPVSRKMLSSSFYPLFQQFKKTAENED